MERFTASLIKNAAAANNFHALKPYTEPAARHIKAPETRTTFAPAPAPSPLRGLLKPAHPMRRLRVYPATN